MQDMLSKSHPLVPFVFFTSVIVFGIAFWHPVFLLISFISAFLYLLLQSPKKTLKLFFKILLPAFTISIVLNMLLNHYGINVLFYLPNRSPVTLESLAMGAVIGALLILVIMWFYCLNEVITTDKVLYLFTKSVPAISLLISMTLRLVPKFKAQSRLIADAQTAIGKGIKNGNLRERIKNAATILSILVTWVLEDSIETAEAMKSRGYGGKSRTSFESYRISTRDIILLILILFCDAVVIFGAITGESSAVYIPTFEFNVITAKSAVVYAVYTVLCLLPVELNITEGIKWRSIQSKI